MYFYKYIDIEQQNLEINLYLPYKANYLFNDSIHIIPNTSKTMTFNFELKHFINFKLI